MGGLDEKILGKGGTGVLLTVIGFQLRSILPKTKGFF